MLIIQYVYNFYSIVCFKELIFIMSIFFFQNSNCILKVGADSWFVLPVEDI